MKLTVPNGFTPAPARSVSWGDYRCGHPYSEVRRLTQSNGIVIATRQCLNCGANLGAVKKDSVTLDTLKWFDKGIQDRYAEKQSGKYQEARSREKEEWNRWYYDVYLQSPKWFRLREKVLIRDNYKCQGCHSALATTVHHLTYERVGRELIFDLISVCDECHGVAHPDKV